MVAGNEHLFGLLRPMLEPASDEHGERRASLAAALRTHIIA